ncbi:unnamed protein product [Spirodela intermedia]|uniref:Uncharacterized protein n=1 Tax=Spirodela intermedia TaxID=51605 RepID=A0A7I8KTK5_SPIIN|nr:unnamed protein product [Spirodela intermedia]
MQPVVVQLQEEKERAMKEVAEMKKYLAKREKEGDAAARIRLLQREVEKAKESERKMLESMISQTKQLEHTKIELEESKLEIRNLLAKPRAIAPTKPESQSQDEMGRLRNELRLATEAEEKNKKAMDDLAMTLKEVTTEMNRLKEKLSVAQADLDRVRAEADHSKSMWMTTEEKFQILVEEVDKLRMEADESATAWNAKEASLIDCMKISEEEITKLKQENSRLEEAQRSAKEESTRFRDIMKQAVNEATVVKEALEIARGENSSLKDLISARENSLKTMKQDLERAKLNEATAMDSVKELQSCLAGEPPPASSIDEGTTAKPKALSRQGSEKRAIPVKFPSERWRSDHPHVQNGLRSAAADPGSISERVTTWSAKKDRTRSSLSCASDLTGSSHLGLHNGDDYPYLDEAGTNVGLPAKQRKKRQILHRFSELLRRGRLPK